MKTDLTEKQFRAMVIELAQVFNGATFDESVLPKGAASWQGTPWVTRLTCQVAKAKRIDSAAAKCSNQADLHSTFIDPI